MLVQVAAWKPCGSEIMPTPGTHVGINVGRVNRDEYFDDVTEVDVEVEGEWHHFVLNKNFWTTCPEIRDTGDQRVFRMWIETHGGLTWEERGNPTYELEKVGVGRFRLSN
jgi:hypothetical protein